MRVLVLLSAWLVFGTAACAANAAAQDATDGMDAEARALYSAGEVAFGEGRFENAMSYFQQAYDLSHRPELLYNVGTAADRLRRDDEALAAFEQYLAERPDAANRGEVERRVAVLREAIGSRAVVPVDDDAIEDHPAPPVPVAPAADTGPGPAPWIVFASGAAVAIAGGVLVGLAVADVAAVENAPPASAWSSVRDAYDRSEAESIAGFVLLGVGGAAMIGGLVWGVLPSGSGTAEGARASLDVGVVPGGVAFRGAF